MSFIHRLVTPKLPTVLASKTRVDLPGYDSWHVYIDQVHIIPTELNISKFEDALSRVLQLYPHVAGQLQCANGRWSIELTNRGIPVDIDHKPGMSSGSLLDGDWVIQDDLFQLLNQHPIGVRAVNSSTPLLRLKLTLFDDETCVGVSWNRSIGDAIVVSRFMRTLSQLYQNLPSDVATPSFEKYDFPTPSSSTVVELSSRFPLHRIRHFDEIKYADLRKDLEQVRWRFDDHSLKEFRLALSSDEANRRFLSKQDCLTAYLVTVLNHNKNHPVEAVKILSSYRRTSAPPISENVAGNLLLTVPVDVPQDMIGIACAIRDALVLSREPSCTHTLGSLESRHILEAANAGRLHPGLLDESEVFVNSHIAIDWCSAHFGCPNGTRFHTNGIYRDMLRCFRSNPVKGTDGVWWSRQSVDISIGVPAGLKPKILKTLARGTKYMIDKELGRVQPWRYLLLLMREIYSRLWTLVW